MPSGKQTYLTKVDEVEFSQLLRVKYPDICFFEDAGFPEPELTFIPSIDVATDVRVYFFIPEPGWQPEFKFSTRDNGYHVTNLPDLCGSIYRSSGGWEPNAFDSNNEPRWITEGAIDIYYSAPPTKAQRSFRDAVWRMLAKIATWRLKPYRIRPRMALHWEKTDKIFWAGNDAVRWARANKLRMLRGSNVYYRPFDEEET